MVVGIDEAGYGPTLGPLVIGASLWRVQPEHVRSDFWKLLSDCVRRKTKAGEWRLRVDDSKRAYDRKKGLHTLERSVLAFASAAGMPVDTLATLIDALGAANPLNASIPWYREMSRPLPLSGVEGKFDTVAQRLGHAMETAGVTCTALLAEVIDEQRFNDRVAHTRNKSAVLVENVLRLIARAADYTGAQDLVARIDRLGGRTSYLGVLRDAFPDRQLTVLEEAEERSRYRLAGAANDWFIEFAVESDRINLPVALASMLAKYVRESLMFGFNAYWQELLPDLRPTAGYYTDAQRFLADIQPVVARADVTPAQFVRTR